MSLSEPKNYRANTSSNWTQRTQRRRKNQKLLAIEECKRLYQKYYAYPSSSLLKQLNENCLNLFLEDLNYSDVNVIRELLQKFYHFQQILISPTDPDKPEPICIRRKSRPTRLTEGEKNHLERIKKSKEKNTTHLIYRLIICISKHLPLTKSLISFALDGIELNKKYCEYITKGLSKNKSLQFLSITNSKMPLDSYNFLVESLLDHPSLSFLDLSNNNFDDKYGKIINRLIARHMQRRDQIIWSYGLRNEMPLTNDYKKGLISINLNGNNLNSDAAEYISSALYSDQYIRAVYLNNNKMDKPSCKKFIYMMRKNLYILTIDLRGNPGYDNSIHPRLVMKMSKNIRFLYQQYKKGEYSEDEFEGLKQFIDITFFDVDIPQNVVDFYNDNLPENMDEDEDKDDNEVKTELEVNKNMSDIPEAREEDEDLTKTGKISNNINDKSNKSFNIIEENKKLYTENLKLKKQLIELKVKNLQKKLLGYKNQNINEINESRESKSESIDSDYNRVELLINELNELMNKIEQKKSHRKLKEKIKNQKESDKNSANENNNINNNINILQNKDIEENNKIKEDKKFERPELKEIISDKSEVSKEKENVKEPDKDKIIEKEKDKKNEEKNEIKIDVKNDLKNEQVIKDDNKKNMDNINKMDDPYRQMLAEPSDKKDKDSDDSHLVDENGNVYNIDDLTDEEKMIIIQQQLILQRLQEEAEARGEQFDPQQYIEYLDRLAKEEEEDEKSDGKLNKSF